MKRHIDRLLLLRNPDPQSRVWATPPSIKQIHPSENHMKEEFIVFYSWQSDTPPNHGRKLIRDALELAKATINADTSALYRVFVQSDTENEPGLCNIPATLLKRLRESDAIVSDLTFIAKTEASEPKHCSNPNVLFELGYAFASVGPERMICVMNEAHGNAAEQIFDLAHHRRPIAFTSPPHAENRQTRKQNVELLAGELEVALRGVMKLGLVGGYGGDDEIQHQRHLSEIESCWHSTGLRKADQPRIAIWFRPKLFRSRRWPDVGVLDGMIRSNVWNGNRNHRYPPVVKGNAPMDWGLYNDTYGDPWAVTYAGQFWTEIDIGGWNELTLNRHDLASAPERPENPVFQKGEWVSGIRVLEEIGAVFQFLRLLSKQFGDHETIQMGFEATGIRGKWLNFGQSADSFGPCRAPLLKRTLEMTREEIRDKWEESATSICKDFIDLFYRDGRSWGHEELKQRLFGNT